MRRALTGVEWLLRRPYAVAGLGVGVALGGALALAPLDDRIPPLLFLTAVAAAGWWGGRGPALAAAGLAVLLLNAFFEAGADSGPTPAALLDLASFLVVALLIGSLNGRLRDALRRAEAARQAAEAALRARDEALAVVSHDLRTPVTAIQASVSALADPALQVSDDTRGHLLANIGVEADRLARFVSDALALGRLEAGVSPAPAPNAPGEVVSAVLDRCAPLLRDRPVAFDVPDTLPLVRLDATLLEQALTNLLENVASHTPPGTPVAVAGGVQGNELRLEVSDSGPGIPAEARERVFQKFERLGKRGPGVGLGLALARAATEAQGGRLWVEEADLGGSRFVLSLPVGGPDGAPAEASARGRG